MTRKMERFRRAWSDRTRGNDFKLSESRFRLDISKELFPVTMMRHWHRFPSQPAVSAPWGWGAKETAVLT